MQTTYRSTKQWIKETFAPLRPLYDAWMTLIAGFSWVLARVVLTVLFFTVFIIYGVMLRLTGKDPINRATHTDQPTYWAENTIDNKTLDDFKTQY
jgi:hypothetical protein